MQGPNDVAGLLGRAKRWLDSRLEWELRHRRRAQRLEAHTQDDWRGVVRASYVAILGREPDDQGRRIHAERLAAGLPLEALLAELALARDAEATGNFADLAAYADAIQDRVTVLEQRLAAYEQRAADEARAEQRTLLALTRRLAVLEDRLNAGEGTPASPTPSAA
ncbi:MAG: hypothetical protein JOZ75_03375 [Candidatus Dormibacteraeota bacterium]|nr:hypothetical protein [Candidatus Dormibacteraeota bacterium]